MTRCGFTLLLLAIAAAACSRTPSPNASAAETETIAIRVQEGTNLAFDISPDGRTIVFDLLGQLWELPSGGGEARPMTDAVRDTAEDLDPSYSPDGQRLVFSGERRGRTGLWLLEPNAKAPRQLTQLPEPEGYHGNATWSPDGNAVVFARFLPPDSAVRRWRSRLARFDLATGETRELDVGGVVGPNLRNPAWTRDGTRLAVVASPARGVRGGRIWLVHAGTGRATPLTGERSEAFSPAFAPDDRRLAFLALDSTRRVQVCVLDLETARLASVCLTSHSDVAPTRVRWTPDGNGLVYSADGRLWKIPVAGGTPTEIRFSAALTFERPKRALPPVRFGEPGLPQTVHNFMSIALSPDARKVGMLALGKLWVMPVGGEARAVADVPLGARHLAWSADGAVLAWSAGTRQEVDLFATDVATGSTRRVTALPGREDYPAYAPNGKHLAFLHEPSEGRGILRVMDVGASVVSDVRQTRSVNDTASGEALWSPASDGVLTVTGGFAPNDSTRGDLRSLSGRRRAVTRMPDSPLSLQWTGNSIVFVRHARLWRAGFDSAGMISPAEPLGAEPAMYASAATDGTVLFVARDGLRLRSPDGREQRLGWPLSYTPPVAEPVLVRNARIIDGTGAPTSAPRDLLVQRGRIREIAGAGTISAGSARVVDAAGRVLIPGLIDLHAHLYRPELSPGYSYFGVTTIRDQGSPLGPLVAYADAIAAGTLDGPRVGYGGFQYYSDWAYDAEDQQGVEPEADSGHVARAVELARAFGSQHIKTRTFRRWDINARMITEAHRRGMRVTGHCAHELPLVAAGIDTKEHAGFCDPRSDGIIYDDLVQLYRAAGIGVVPTIAYSSLAARLNERPDLLERDTELAPFLPERGSFNWMLRLDSTGRRQFARFAESARQATTRLARAGVTIGTGTDIWQTPTGVHMELEELVGAGLTPLEAIQAGTGGAARILGAEGELGTIAVGKWADLIILDADPVADIRNTRRIWAVMQGGRVVDRAAILERLKHQSPSTRHN